MARHAKTQHMIDEARAILADFHPMTVRQVYYQLVSRQVENTRSRYQAVSDVLVAARREGSSPGSGSTIGCVFCAIALRRQQRPVSPLAPLAPHWRGSRSLPHSADSA